MRSADGRFEYRALDDTPLPDGTAPADVHRFAYRCRRDPGSWCTLNLRGRGHDIDKKSWTWDGNLNHPTIAPSINCDSDRCWHGFVTSGQMRKGDNVTPEERQ